MSNDNNSWTREEIKASTRENFVKHLPSILISKMRTRQFDFSTFLCRKHQLSEFGRDVSFDQNKSKCRLDVNVEYSQGDVTFHKFVALSFYLFIKHSLYPFSPLIFMRVFPL